MTAKWCGHDEHAVESRLRPDQCTEVATKVPASQDCEFEWNLYEWGRFRLGDIGLAWFDLEAGKSCSEYVLAVEGPGYERSEG